MALGLMMKRWASLPSWQVIAVVLALVFYGYYGFYKMIFVHFDLVGGDFIKGYYASRNFFEDMSIYAMPEGVNPYFYPPLSLAVFLPLGKLDIKVVAIIGFAVTHLIVLFSAWLMYKCCGGYCRRDAAVATIVVVGFSMPLQGLILTGNINIVILLGLCSLLYWVLAGKSWKCPAIIACLTWIKIYPAIFMVPFIWGRKWKDMGGYFLVCIALGAISVAVFGLKSHMEFIRQLPDTTHFVGVFPAVSFVFVLKLLMGEGNERIIILLNAVFAVALLGLYWSKKKSARSPNCGAAGLFVDLALVTVVMMLVVPSSWLFWQAFLLPFQVVVLFLWLQGWSQFKRMSMFGGISILISGWEIIVRQLPIPGVGVTLYQVGERRTEFPIFYPGFQGLPFLLIVGIFVWLLLNYEELRRGVESMVLKAGKC